MDYKKFSDKIRAKYLINIFLLIGFLIAGIRLEYYLYETQDYYDKPVLANNELVLNEQSSEEYILSEHGDKKEHIPYYVDDISNIYSYRFTNKSYNSLVLNKYKTIISNYNFHSVIISILQKNNIWHKSSGEQPGILASS
jgi:hypothetical protein